MNIDLSTEHIQMLEAEAKRRSTDEAIITTDDLISSLLRSAAESYRRTAQEDYARSLYERIATADPATQKAIFTSAEKALSESLIP